MNNNDVIFMKKKKIIPILSALAVAFSCVNMPVSATENVTENTEITVSNNPELWKRFLKYDLRITDYDALSYEEKDLCKFIFETELNSPDTIICERARRILADIVEKTDY